MPCLDLFFNLGSRLSDKNDKSWEKKLKLFWLEKFGEKNNIIGPKNNLFLPKNEYKLYKKLTQFKRHVSKTITNWQLSILLCFSAIFQILMWVLKILEKGFLKLSQLYSSPLWISVLVNMGEALKMSHFWVLRFQALKWSYSIIFKIFTKQ